MIALSKKHRVATTLYTSIVLFVCTCKRKKGNSTGQRIHLGLLLSPVFVYSRSASGHWCIEHFSELPQLLGLIFHNLLFFCFFLMNFGARTSVECGQGTVILTIVNTQFAHS